MRKKCIICKKMFTPRLVSQGISLPRRASRRVTCNRDCESTAMLIARRIRQENTSKFLLEENKMLIKDLAAYLRYTTEYLKRKLRKEWVDMPVYETIALNGRKQKVYDKGQVLQYLESKYN